MTNDGTYLYIATVPNNKDKQKFVISKILVKDMVLSSEFTPQANLKEKSSLGDLYITSMAYKDDKIYALSKNHNIIIIIDPKNEIIEKSLSYPSEISNARSLFFKDNTLYVLSYQNGKNTLFGLE